MPPPQPAVGLQVPAGALFGLVALAGGRVGAVFFLWSSALVGFLSRKLEEVLTRSGQAEIYRMIQGQGVVGIAFGFGRRTA